MLMAVMSFAFGYLAGFENRHSVPYPLIIFCGVIPWYFVSNAVPDGMNSLRVHIYVIQKTYFPRALIPIAAVFVDAIEFLLLVAPRSAACGTASCLVGRLSLSLCFACSSWCSARQLGCGLRC